MAIGRVERRGVEALPRRQRQSRSGQGADTFFQQEAPPHETTASRVVNGLFEFTGKAMDVAVRREKSKIELDKVTQQQRALQGLDPTDDATNAGIRAYQMINVRDDVLRTNAELAETIRTNPDMDEEQYELATREAYAPLLEQYQADPQLSQALSNRLQESQTQLHQIRSAAQREHRDWQRQETFKTSIEEYREAAASPQELAAMIDGGQLENEASALGVTPEQYRTSLVQMAAMDAEQGDGRILNAIEAQGWASTDERVAKAREVYASWEARNNAVEIGTQWGEIQQGWKNRTSSWSQTEEAIRRVNERFPGSITANQVASLRQQAAAQHNKDAEKNQALRAYYASQNSDRPIRLGSAALMPDEHRDHIISTTVEQIDTQARQMQATGEMAPEEAEAWAMQSKLQWGREEGVEVPGISDIISSLSLEDPSQWTGDGVPSYFTPALSTIAMMNESDIEKYGDTERDKNLMRTYQQFRSETGPDRNAWRRAYSRINNVANMSPEERSTLVDTAEQEIHSELSRNLWQRVVQGEEEVSDSLRPYLSRRARMRAESLAGSGGLDPKATGKTASHQELAEVTLIGRSFVTRGTQHLIRESAFIDEDGQQYQLAEQDIRPAFESFFTNNKDRMALESMYGQDLELDNVYFQTNPGGLIMPVDDQGDNLLDAPVTMQELTRDYVRSEAQRRADRAADAAERRANRPSGNQSIHPSYLTR